MIQLNQVDNHSVIDVWAGVKPYIDRAIEGSSDTTTEYILGRIVDGDYKLWIGSDDDGKISYVGVTRLEYFAAVEKLACLVMYLAGDDLDNWAHLALASLESWAMDNDCDELRITGRPGWERVFKGDGFRKTHTILAKPLGEKQ